MESFVGPSPSMAARLAFALFSAAVLGAWLHRRGGSGSDGVRAASLLRAATLALCACWSVVWIGLGLLRLPHPYELEWCGGAMRDMAARALHGQSLYVAPGPGWFPYEYPPLYFWVSALLMRLLGGEPSFIALRLVSIASTLGSTALMAWWTRRMSGSRTWGLIAAGLFLASYRFTGAWYDVERLDMLFLLLSLAGICCLQRSVEKDSAGWAVAAAAAHVLAFLTKQQAVLFMAGAVAALLWGREGKLAAAYGAAAVAGCAGSVAALSHATDGWFWYYCFRVPMANGIRANLAVMYVTLDLPLFAPLIVLLAVAAIRGRRAQGERNPPLLWGMLAMGVGGSFLSRAHWGGDQNVLMTGYAMISVAACAAAGRLAKRLPPTRAPLFALCLAQLLTLTYRPAAQLPGAQQRIAGQHYADLIRSLEREGPVLSLDHGGFTTEPHFHLMGLLDVAHTERALPGALTDALRAHHYTAIVMDAKPETEGLLQEIARDYPRRENVGITDSWTVTGFPTPTPARSVWVLRP